MDQRVFQGMEYVYQVYKEGSFLKAAEKLIISQPSISASVRRVEERLGCDLFDRSTKPLRLTECGEQYIRYAEKIMAMEREFSEYVNDWGGLRRGRLILGGSSLFSSLVLPPLMVAFRQRFPQIELELVEETTGKLEQMLHRGTIDLMVDYAVPDREHCEASVVEEDYLIVCVPQANPLNEKLKPCRLPPELIGTAEQGQIPALPLEAFREEGFILLKPENDTRIRAERLCRERGFAPKAMMEFDQQMTAYLVSCSGAGIAFASSSMVSRMKPNPTVCYYRLDGEASRRQVCIFWKQGRYVTRAMEEFLSLAANQRVAAGASTAPKSSFSLNERGKRVLCR